MDRNARRYLKSSRVKANLSAADKHDDREGKTPSSVEPEGAEEYLASLPDTTDEKEGRR